MKRKNPLKIDLAEIIRNIRRESLSGETLKIVEEVIPSQEKYLREGIIFYQREDYDKALKIFEKALKLNPERAEIYYHRGLVYQAKGLWKEAAREYKKTLELNPEDVEAHNNLGVVYYNQGRLEKAKEQFEIALSINPDFEIARKNLRLLEEK